jgi:hypothetical protein
MSDTKESSEPFHDWLESDSLLDTLTAFKSFSDSTYSLLDSPDSDSLEFLIYDCDISLGSFFD